MNDLIGMKELYDINIRLNQPIEIGKRRYEINETILSFERAEIAQIVEEKTHKKATGGYHNNMLIDWEIDTQANFAITHGVLSPSTWAVLSNSKLTEKESKSVPYKETLLVTEEQEDVWTITLKYIPNHVDKKMGIQGNPENEPMPMGRVPWLPLKPLPPSKEHFIFCYDADTGKRILNFDIYGNKIIFKAPHRKIMIDYTFDYDDDIVELEVGNRLLNNFMNLTGKMTTKDYFSGEPKTAIIEIPRIKIYSNLAMRLGSDYNDPIVSDFYFTGYPPENKYDDRIFKLTFLNHELTGEYV